MIRTNKNPLQHRFQTKMSEWLIRVPVFGKLLTKTIFTFLVLLLCPLSMFAQQVETAAPQQGQEDPAPVETQHFYSIPQSASADKKSRTMFLKSVTEHIIRNQGIQNFYTIPEEEKRWLQTITQSDRGWHEELEHFEKQYRSAFGTFVHEKSGQNSNAILEKQYSKAIAKLQSEIDLIRRQIVQINVDQQVYISNLRNLPLNTLVAVKTPFTDDLAGSGKSENLSKAIFRFIEEPVLAHVTNRYSSKLNIPFQNGKIQVTFLYPENITRFDNEANEYVYLFQHVAAYPFAPGVTSVDSGSKRNVQVQILTSEQEIQAFLKSESVGDKRLQDWLRKELAYQQVNNDYTLQTINMKLSYFTMFRNGLKEDIKKIMESIRAFEKKRDALNGEIQGDSPLQALRSARQNYQKHYRQRKVLTFEKYTLEHDVMFSSLTAGKASKKKGEGRARQLILDSRIADNIPISGRPVKDIFADMLQSASQNRSLNLESYRERVYQENEEQTHFVQGELEWKIDREEYRILKLARGSVGSRSQFVIHLAKQVYLNSNPSFPSPKSGICDFSITFNQGKSTLNKAARNQLQNIARCLRKYPTQPIVITGHTDPLKPQFGEGSKLNNVQLGMRRAEEVMNTLTGEGFDPGRFTLISVGAQEPIATGTSKKALQKNRRAHILSQPQLR